MNGGRRAVQINGRASGIATGRRQLVRFPKSCGVKFGSTEETSRQFGTERD